MVPHYWSERINGNHALSAILQRALVYKHRDLLFLDIYLKDRMKWSLLHMTQILLPADKRINFIPIKQNGNCHITMAIDILRNLLSQKKPHKSNILYNW